ncbi:MAG: tyrosine-type recombinase/integrase [Bacteroidales bacterium]|nr:tyrosine-type recombinase/integrase [Bacteroidales bacterium]
MDLTPKNISYENDKIFLNVREQKTQKNKINLPHLLFYGKAVKIIEKYKTVYRQTIFPPITNTSVNRHLKSIAQSVGIEKELSFHCSRHTFGTYLANHNGDASLIKLLMNHSDYKTSYRYIHESKRRAYKLKKQTIGDLFPEYCLIRINAFRPSIAGRVDDILERQQHQRRYHCTRPC